MHKSGKGLLPEAIKHLKPIFSDLSDNLLRNCLHGKTRNQNESFNGLIWRRTPKDRFVKMITFELAVCDAVAHFNIGNHTTLHIFDKVNIERGYYPTLGCITDNNCRIQNAKRQSMDKAWTKKVSGNTHKTEGKICSAGNL